MNPWWLRRIAGFVLSALAVLPASAEPVVASSPALPARVQGVAAALRAELLRNMSQLRLAERPQPYYLAYTHVAVRSRIVEAQLGELTTDTDAFDRGVKVNLRVGSADFDNSRAPDVDSHGFVETGDSSVVSVPLLTDGIALRRSLWLATDRLYRRAVVALETRRADRESQIDVEAPWGDFGPAIPARLVADDAEPGPTPEQLREAVKKASRYFVGLDAVQESRVAVTQWRIEELSLTSEGGEAFRTATLVEVATSARTQAEDGFPAELEAVDYFRADGSLHLSAVLDAQVQQVANELTRLRGARLASDYSGPVLFEGSAAAQLAFELLGQAVVGGAPLEEAHPWLRKLNQRVMPDFVDVSDDPTRASPDGGSSVGCYPFDEQAIAPTSVSLVEAGRLRRLLMSRTPNRLFDTTSGHARSGYSGWPHAHVSNLQVTARKGKRASELHAELLRLVSEQGGSYGLVIESLQPRAFSTNGATPPSVYGAYRLYLDGHQEPIRGASLEAMSPRFLKEIVAAGKKVSRINRALHTGVVPLPFTVSSPALLFEDLELRKRVRAHARPPVLSRP